MKKLLLLPISIFIFVCCNHSGKEKNETENTRVMLRADTLNVVKLTDTLIIYESTCRGCAYEKSTLFDISDTLGVVKLTEVITTDNNPSDMNGGSISKDLILVPQKTGFTTFKLYKFWDQNATAQDSARFTLYQLEVKN